MNVMAQLTALREFLDDLRDPGRTDEERFHELVRQGIKMLLLSDDEFSREFGISRTSVNRWKNGRNAPLPIVRPQVYAFLAKRTKKAIAALEGLSRTGSSYPVGEPMAAKER